MDKKKNKNAAKKSRQNGPYIERTRTFKKKKFVEAYADNGGMLRSCEIAGIHHTTLSDWKDKDPKFASEVEVADLSLQMAVKGQFSFRLCVTEAIERRRFNSGVVGRFSIRRMTATIDLFRLLWRTSNRGRQRAFKARASLFGPRWPLAKRSFAEHNQYAEFGDLCRPLT